MAIQLQKAKRTLAKIKLSIGGPTGSGKTLSSLLLAFGLIKAEHPEYTDAQCWEKICIIDTENASASLYTNFSVGPYRTGEYYTIPIGPPFDATKYIDAIHAAEQGGMQVIIIDSLTHAWTGEGGALDKQGKIAAKTGNSYTAWRDVTPEHNRLVDAMLQSPCHLIADIRAKMDYIQEKNANNKTVVRSVGMGLQMRDGIEYEFTTSFMLDNEHTASATKDRTGLFDGKYFTITPETGKLIYQWLASGAPEAPKAPAPAPAQPAPAQAAPAEAAAAPGITQEQVHAVVTAYNAAHPERRADTIARVKAITGGTANYLTITDPAILTALYDEFKE